ncbi:S8 family serine peptidase [Pseudochryseolinea flava]|uniref:Peptidase S8/S53 domain-containing protein n=1 Tax=Pseudochryseolinea flava TaxID=2059302 RepID=A0A364XUX7_9BACT|nr:S8 family serine peptidase [Pseudochryseolinea flava]RAV98132.1 hypothetical protein DQQ10_25005 [Pseudochryseolinea flava]
MISLRTILLIASMIDALLLCTNALAQEKFSPKIKSASHARLAQQIQFSVAVRDPQKFKSQYQSKVVLVDFYETTRIFRISSSIDFVVHAFAADKNILFVDLLTRPHVESRNSTLNTALNRINKAKQLRPALRGHNMMISIKEQSFDKTDLDLRGRTVETSESPRVVSEHATAMATFIAGIGNTSEKGLGVANEAIVTASDFSDIFPDDVAYFDDYNILQQNHSYGTSIENYYGNEAVSYDEQVYSNPDLLHVFSAGNIGNSKPTAGDYHDLNWANLSGNFKHAKNVLVVTAIDTSLNRNPMNSRGPTFDGRVKPELTAYGEGGTSDAAALVTGMTALIREAVKNKTMPTSAALLKALLIASAEDVGDEGIDFTFGYGYINLWQAVQDVEQERFFNASLNHDEFKQFTITVPENVRELRIATAWTDPPSTVNALQALVNDIDSYLIYDEQKVLPWVLNHFPHSDSLSARNERRQDHLNNVELISINNPKAGTYQLVLYANLVSSAQDVAVAYSVKSADLAWDFPAMDEVIEADTRVKLFWNNPLDQRAAISMKLNEGEWNTIVDDVAEGETSVSWVTPDTLANASLRLEVGGKIIESPAFVISPRPKLTVPFVCDDVFALSWSPVAGASTYDLVTLVGDSTTVVRRANDTLFVGAKGANHFYTVQPRIESKTGLKADMINYNMQGSNCYVNLFSAYRFDDVSNKVEIHLSTHWNVSRVTFFLVDDNGMLKALDTQSPGKQKYFTFLDEHLTGEIMRYTAVVELVDGTRLSTEIVSVLVEQKNRAILFPNPADEFVTVLSEGDGGKLHIVDRQGRYLLSFELGTRIEEIDIARLSPGLYYFQYERAGNVTDSGRFVKL